MQWTYVCVLALQGMLPLALIGFVIGRVSILLMWLVLATAMGAVA